MKLMATCFVLALSWNAVTRAAAQLELVGQKSLQPVFGGTEQKIALLWRDQGEIMLETDIRMRTVQLTSASAAVIREAPWKKLQVLPGQTVLETATVLFPDVKAETHFLVQWLQNSNVLGSTEFLVYPTNLLGELQPLVGHEDSALGIFDPQNQLKPLLKNARVDFVDLGNVELEKYRGKLAIIGPFESETQADRALATRIKTIAEKGVAVVWIQPPSEGSPGKKEKLTPSFYSIPQNQTAAVIIQPQLIDNLRENPSSQLNLVYFCKIALHPQPLTFPAVQLQP